MKHVIKRAGWRIGMAMSAGLAGIIPALAAPQPAAPQPAVQQPAAPQPAAPAPGSQKPAETAPAQHPAGAPAKPEEEHLKDVTSLLGQDVHTPDGQRIGRIEDVLVDATAHPRAVVVDFGGFMGIGSRKVAVAWDKMHFPPEGAKNQKIICDLTPEQIKAAPEYKEGKKPVTVTGAPPKPAAPAPSSAAPAPGPSSSAAAPPAAAPPAPASPTPAPASPTPAPATGAPKP